MNKRLLIAAAIVLLVVVVVIVGLFFWHFVNPKTIKRAEKEEVTALVENFGLKLKEVSLSDPREEIVSQEIKQVYTPFVSSNFLLNLIYDPSKAPGRVASSPWPEKIEIISMEKLDSHTIQVKGKIILMTSVEMTQGGNAGETPIMLRVKNVNADSAWLIDQLSFGDYAFYDGKELYNILKNAFPNMSIIGGRGEPFVAQSIDITGDYIPEAIVDMQIGGAYTEYYTVCRFVNGKLEVAQFKDKNGNVSTMFIYEGASVQHEVKLSFINDGKGNHAIYQYTINKSTSDPKVISTITVEAYKWNEATKLFEYNEELSIEFEQEEEKLLMPGLQPVMVITDSTGNISTEASLPKGISGKAVYVYLQSNVLQPNLGGKMFCAYSLFGSEVKNNKTYMYFWALWEEYRSENRKLVEGTGMGCPITLIAIPSQQGYTITEHQLPENGAAYAPSIKKMFPLKYYNEIFSKTHLFNTVIAQKLMDNVENQARGYYNLR